MPFIQRPFTLRVPDDQLAQLHERLALTRFPDELEGAEWHYGAPLADVKRLINRWRDGFDWRAAEAKINTLPQFTADIDVDGFGTLNIHFVHQKSKVQEAIPLLFVHGCKFISHLRTRVWLNIIQGRAASSRCRRSFHF
jgi:hypothetical protein